MDLILLLFLIIGVLVLALVFLYSRFSSLKQSYTDLTFTYKSAAVKHGQHWEQFVPFMDAFTKVAQRENFVFIGMPIDGISFDDNGIKFIEIKTGKSQLNQKQKQVKDHVQKKNVEWIELRF
ncbi:MAG: Holliday junction resolvase-like protein [Candidatus Woesearchaeota archaeon]|nr:Holliday junction resolvase-like protein [Candidatus Woesearchaeota archaeon]